MLQEGDPVRVISDMPKRAKAGHAEFYARAGEKGIVIEFLREMHPNSGERIRVVCLMNDDSIKRFSFTQLQLDPPEHFCHYKRKENEPEYGEPDEED